MQTLLSLPLAAIQGFPKLTFVDAIDILLVAILAYQIYKAVRGTNVLRIIVQHAAHVDHLGTVYLHRSYSFDYCLPT